MNLEDIISKYSFDVTTVHIDWEKVAEELHLKERWEAFKNLQNHESYDLEDFKAGRMFYGYFNDSCDITRIFQITDHIQIEFEDNYRGDTETWTAFIPNELMVDDWKEVVRELTEKYDSNKTSFDKEIKKIRETEEKTLYLKLKQKYGDK